MRNRALVVVPALLLGVLSVAAGRSHAAEADDRKAVADLDTQYQQAVKTNDAATMDRILADDFVLVTGRGQTFTKADLLAQARGKVVLYEHQEDTNQTVRVWGDTAVVTALLWLQTAHAANAADESQRRARGGARRGVGADGVAGRRRTSGFTGHASLRL